MYFLYCFEYIILTCRFLSDKISNVKYCKNRKVVYNMFSNYLIYLYTLPKEEKIEQILLLLAFFAVLLAICGLLTFIKLKFLNDNKNSLFQRFLKRL